MMKLRFDLKLHRALTLRVSEYLHDTDETIARRIEQAPKGVPIAIPEDSALWEQAVTMLLAEVFCNLSAALRRILGPDDGDEKLGPIVAQALAKAIAARQEMDGIRKERAS